MVPKLRGLKLLALNPQTPSVKLNCPPQTVAQPQSTDDGVLVAHTPTTEASMAGSCIRPAAMRIASHKTPSLSPPSDSVSGFFY